MSQIFRIKGLDKMMNVFKTKPAQLQKVVEQELSRSALRVERRAKELAPFDTGYMSDNIYSMYQDVLKYAVVSPAEYSIYVEKGTRRLAAQPFIHPALQEEQPVIMARLKRLFRRAR